jgi:hypothetical protein
VGVSNKLISWTSAQKSFALHILGKLHCLKLWVALPNKKLGLIRRSQQWLYRARALRVTMQTDLRKCRKAAAVRHNAARDHRAWSFAIARAVGWLMP